eukprot:1497003-Amphidinium_carterae.1
MGMRSSEDRFLRNSFASISTRSTPYLKALSGVIGTNTHFRRFAAAATFEAISDSVPMASGSCRAALGRIAMLLWLTPSTSIGCPTECSEVGTVRPKTTSWMPCASMRQYALPRPAPALAGIIVSGPCLQSSVTCSWKLTSHASANAFSSSCGLSQGTCNGAALDWASAGPMAVAADSRAHASARSSTGAVPNNLGLNLGDS